MICNWCSSHEKEESIVNASNSEEQPVEEEVVEEKSNDEDHEEEKTEDEIEEEKIQQELEEEKMQEEVEEEHSNNHQDGDEDYGMVEEKRRRRRKRQVAQSANPLESGVVYTSYGAVAAGAVLAGVAAGSEPQSAKLSDIIKDPSFPLSESSMQRTIESIWVSTLAGINYSNYYAIYSSTYSFIYSLGDIAQTALLRTPKLLPSFGPRGKWNSTFCPREYKLDLNDHSLLTNAEFYGGIDGKLTID